MHLLVCCIILGFIVSNCKKKEPNPNSNDYTQLNNTLGYGILSKIRGIWDGPVSSSTALGSYPQWIVDFRPISASQISSKNELDPLNSIQMSFFIAKYNNEYRVCFRNGGSFNGNTRISYFLVDSVFESSTISYYRFNEIIKGKTRAYTEMIFNNDSLQMNSYTNKYNSLIAAVLHSSWNAKRLDISSSEAALAHFNFPQKILAKDLTNAFDAAGEAIFYNSSSPDPYGDDIQPYLGQANISYTFAAGYTPIASKKVFLMISTQPLISGFSINLDNLKYRSRYVILDANDIDFNFNLMHPGTYFLYALYDADDNKFFSSGDWVSTTNTSFVVPEKGVVSATTNINFSIP